MKRDILIGLLLLSACTQNIQPTPTYELPTASATAMTSPTATFAASVTPAPYEQYTAPIQLFHGTADPVVPVSFAQETCAVLTNAGININCMYFTGEGDSVRSRVSDQFFGTQFTFYQKYLPP